MRKAFNILLGLCVLGLAYACYWSINSDIKFDKDLAEREAAVKNRLYQIRDAEEEYNKVHGHYCGDIDSLIMFVKNDSTVDRIIKDGDLTDDQLEAGMTEREAVRRGLIKRDTVKIATWEKLNGITNPDSLKFMPVGKGEIQLRAEDVPSFNKKANDWESVNCVEFRASLDDYTDGMDAKHIKALKNKLKKLGKDQTPFLNPIAEEDIYNQNSSQLDDEEEDWYGLRMGDLSDPENRMAGNWD